jgi:hypothetical protein
MLAAMTTTSVRDPSTALPAAAPRPFAADRWFYVSIAVVAGLVCVAGFAPSMIDTSARRGPMTPIVLVHAVLAGGWIALYFVQAVLVATRRVATHKRLGAASAILAAGVVVTAWQASVEAVRRGYDLSGDLSVGPGSPLAQSVFSFGNGVIFGALVLLALLLRRRPQAHNRLMTLAVIQQLMTAPLAHLAGHWRMQIPIIPLWSLVVLIVMLVHDRRTRGRIHPASLYGGLALIAVGAIQAAVIGPSQAWQDFAVWLAR